MNTDEVRSKDQPLICQFRTCKVDKQTDTQAGYAKIVHQLRTMDIIQSLFSLDLNDNLIINDKIAEIGTNFLFPIVNLELLLPTDCPVVQSKVPTKRIHIDLFEQAAAQGIMNPERRSKDVLGKILMKIFAFLTHVNAIGFICVHLWFHLQLIF